MLKVEKKAIRVAIGCMERRKKKLAFDKNLHDKLEVNNPSAVDRSDEWHELNDAIQILVEIMQKYE